MSTPTRQLSPHTVSLKTPGFPRHTRLALAARALRDERCVAKWLRGEPVMPLAAEALERAAAELGIKRVAP